MTTIVASEDQKLTYSAWSEECELYQRVANAILRRQLETISVAPNLHM